MIGVLTCDAIHLFFKIIFSSLLSQNKLLFAYLNPFLFFNFILNAFHPLDSHLIILLLLPGIDLIDYLYIL